MLRKREAVTNQINLWHEIMQHKSVLYSQNWFPLTSCRALASLHPPYLLCNEAHPMPIIKYLYNTGGKIQTATKNINPRDILSSYQHCIFFASYSSWTVIKKMRSVCLMSISALTVVINMFAKATRTVQLIWFRHEPSWSRERTDRSAQTAPESLDPQVLRIWPWQEGKKQDELTNLTNLECDQI